ncbi:MAG: hypothetical protein BWX59_02209 [Bacteroidetes bacterium ADurb.Bin028]|jgi:hypothetical protein|nr:MAG: hypothetical protein BWX59_02209 [Bacteroidetes bacterium ADurb.Bin028]
MKSLGAVICEMLLGESQAWQKHTNKLLWPPKTGKLYNDLVKNKEEKYTKSIATAKSGDIRREPKVDSFYHSRERQSLTQPDINRARLLRSVGKRILI